MLESIKSNLVLILLAILGICCIYLFYLNFSKMGKIEEMRENINDLKLMFQTYQNNVNRTIGGIMEMVGGGNATVVGLATTSIGTNSQSNSNSKIQVETAPNIESNTETVAAKIISDAVEMTNKQSGFEIHDYDSNFDDVDIDNLNVDGDIGETRVSNPTSLNLSPEDISRIDKLAAQYFDECSAGGQTGFDIDNLSDLDAGSVTMDEDEDDHNDVGNIGDVDDVEDVGEIDIDEVNADADIIMGNNTNDDNTDDIEDIDIENIDLSNLIVDEIQVETETIEQTQVPHETEAEVSTETIEQSQVPHETEADTLTENTEQTHEDIVLPTDLSMEDLSDKKKKSGKKGRKNKIN